MSWTNLAQLEPQELQAVIPQEDPNLMFVLDHKEGPQFTKFCRLISVDYRRPSTRMDLLLRGPSEMNLTEWYGKTLGQLPWVVESFTHDRPMVAGEGHLTLST